jgi:hypothetical protein
MINSRDEDDNSFQRFVVPCSSHHSYPIDDCDKCDKVLQATTRLGKGVSAPLIPQAAHTGFTVRSVQQRGPIH